MCANVLCLKLRRIGAWNGLLVFRHRCLIKRFVMLRGQGSTHPTLSPQICAKFDSHLAGEWTANMFKSCSLADLIQYSTPQQSFISALHPWETWHAGSSTRLQKLDAQGSWASCLSYAWSIVIWMYKCLHSCMKHWMPRHVWWPAVHADEKYILMKVTCKQT